MQIRCFCRYGVFPESWSLGARSSKESTFSKRKYSVCRGDREHRCSDDSIHSSIDCIGPVKHQRTLAHLTSYYAFPISLASFRHTQSTRLDVYKRHACIRPRTKRLPQQLISVRLRTGLDLLGVEEPLTKKAIPPMKYKMCAGGSKNCCPVRAKQALNIREREFFKV